ncbi:MAG TPA: hypothetical protein VFS83_16420 [Ktedonobacterales bacterium]|nr:hypothetical protein [Ktedonobacterales bacterium]
MGTHAQAFRRNRFSALLARPWASRLIATLGIVVMTVGLYVPVAGSEIRYHADPVTVVRVSGTWTIANAGVVAPVAFVSLPLPLVLGQAAVYALITFGGLALLPLLWRPLSPRGIAVARWLYTIWLVLLPLLAVARLPNVRQFLSQPLPGPLSETYTLEAAYLLPGVVVFPLGVLISCAALLLLLRREPLPLASPAPAPRTTWQWIAAFTITVGTLVWGVGFYLMPQVVTADCPPVIFSVTQFAHGACAGLDSDQVLTAAANAGFTPLARVFVLASGYTFLVAAGGITAFGGWTRQLSVATLAWLAVWPILALGVALVALQGVGVIAQRGFKLTFETGENWHIASGMIVTFAGIGLVVLGQLGLWRELVRHGRSRDRHVS